MRSTVLSVEAEGADCLAVSLPLQAEKTTKREKRKESRRDNPLIPLPSRERVLSLEEEIGAL
jgi:hypothetical protein